MADTYVQLPKDSDGKKIRASSISIGGENVFQEVIQVTDSSGAIVNPAIKERQDPTAGYKLSDSDDDASPNYYGYVDSEGNWYIMLETISTGNNTYRFVSGTSGYTTNWTNRAGLTYGYFYEAF